MSWVSQGDCRAREGASCRRLFAGDQARQLFAAGVCGSARISVATRAPRRRAPSTDLGCASAIPRYSQRHPRRHLRSLYADRGANDTSRRRRCRQRAGAKGPGLPVPPARQHRRLSSVLDQRAYGVTWPINFSGGRVPHCERNPSSAETRLPPLCTFNRSVSAQCSCTRPHGSAQ
jgi:hypothetical protein